MPYSTLYRLHPSPSLTKRVFHASWCTLFASHGTHEKAMETWWRDQSVHVVTTGGRYYWTNHTRTHRWIHAVQCLLVRKGKEKGERAAKLRAVGALTMMMVRVALPRSPWWGLGRVGGSAFSRLSFLALVMAVALCLCRKTVEYPSVALCEGCLIALILDC